MNSVLLSITISILFGIGTFLILRRDIIKVIIGLSILSHAVNLLIASTGIFDGDKVPIITGSHESAVASGTIFTDDVVNGVMSPVVSVMTGTHYVDPLVQALVLTAIVISLAITAFILILAYRIHEEYKTTDLNEMKRLRG
ncbi:MAG: NADH-quinone oxidoreductase subunit K [Methanosarcinaceae archaeon]|nr:NADH-quinone oxidoreductase subunit K [Methanosarcinaceae archaeon]